MRYLFGTIGLLLCIAGTVQVVMDTHAGTRGLAMILGALCMYVASIDSGRRGTDGDGANG